MSVIASLGKSDKGLLLLSRTCAHRKAAPKGGIVPLLETARERHGVTTKGTAAVPPAVVITRGPLFAPVGTVACTSVSEITVKAAFNPFTPPKVTAVVCLRLTP